MRTILITCLLLAASPVLAHGGKHHGATVEGTVVSVAGDVVELDTAAGRLSVTLTEETEISAAGKPAGRAALHPGLHVTVLGSRLPGGMVAHEVELPAP